VEGLLRNELGYSLGNLMLLQDFLIFPKLVDLLTMDNFHLIAEGLTE
jgi:hypothetical protein